ncbi:hypothetical protein GYMLUDRAFT_44149 [Collybiopsis luxurians FD-317 M1]|uniref:Major facilitator superfamily (MFS) profile domain-containing protein n=1 Tax=Collybiopsis luxurians FD-317 M1 TaxID=944289 RepID=A0A0D0BVY1_9AGAR|nr:hypothetical protein GYMLUDRAFT_44149 [Collybiopsis luxurians FD-317 M1]
MSSQVKKNDGKKDDIVLTSIVPAEPQESSHAGLDKPHLREQRRNTLGTISGWRKGVLLFIFCFAQFLDAFNNSALFAAIPPISTDIGINNSNSVWIISAYQLTFASLLLMMGSFSDLYSPKWAFIGGLFIISFSSLGSGFVRAQLPLFILRAIMGIGAAVNIPSALAMIISMFPDPAKQGQALGLFTAAVAIGNVTGLFIGAALAAYASWTWIFYLVTILGIAMVAGVLLVMPLRISTTNPEFEGLSHREKFKRLDLPGVGTLTVSLVLLVYAVTTGSIDGWGKAKVIVPLVLFFVLLVAFFQWEARIPEYIAAVPPKMWDYQNFTILVIVALQPLTFWVATQVVLSWYWQFVFDWSTISVAVHFLPVGLAVFPFTIIAVILQKTFPLKWVILMGETLALAGMLLLPFGDTKPHYWRYAFPGFLLGSAGTTVVYATTSIALFAATPQKVAGIVGAIFNCAIQVGAAAGSAIITSIQTSVEQKHGGPNSYYGRSAGFWFMFACAAAETLGVIIFMKNTVPAQKETAKRPSGDSSEESA